MALLGEAAVAMWWDIEAGDRCEFEAWHSHEHLPERMGIPGFRRGSRWQCTDGSGSFFVIYELTAFETLTSDGYLRRLNAPTPWSAKMMPKHLNMVRSQCRVVESRGGGVASHVATIRFSPLPGREEDLDRKVRSGLADIVGRPGVTGGHLLRTDTPLVAPTTEQRIRGGDAVADWIVLVSGFTAEALDAIEQSELCSTALEQHGAGAGPLRADFSLRLAFTPEDLAARNAHDRDLTALLTASRY